jgi:histidinol-phosphate aminotransferase
MPKAHRQLRDWIREAANLVPPDILVPPHILALRPYEPGLSAEEVKQRFGLDRVVKLASNENPLGSSPLAVECASRALAGMALYPDGGLALRRKLARRFDLKLENVIVGAGSEGIMANVVRTFLCDRDEVLTTDAAFGGFQVLARGRGVHYRTVPYRDWGYDLPALADAGNERTKLIYLANPNNPTGTFFTRKAFEEFHARVPERVLIILDEAYFEFAMNEPSYPDSMHYRFDNVITLRTFSKAHGLASARVGYGFAHENLISMLLKVKLPFEPSGISAAAALGALEDYEFVQKTIENNRRGLAFLSRELVRLGFQVIPSAANFVTIVLESADRAQHVFDKLLRRGIIVRPLKATGLPECLRISVGTPEENEMCVDAMQRVHAELEADRYATTH